MLKEPKKVTMIIGLVLSKILIIPGFINILLAFATKTIPLYNGWWIVSGIGLAVSIVLLSIVITNVFKNGQITQVQDNQIRTLNSVQINFSFINILLSLGIGLLSTIFALYALDQVISIKTTSGSSLAERQLKTAKILNITAVILIGVRWLAIILFIFSIQKV